MARNYEIMDGATFGNRFLNENEFKSKMMELYNSNKNRGIDIVDEMLIDLNSFNDNGGMTSIMFWNNFRRKYLTDNISKNIPPQMTLIFTGEVKSKNEISELESLRAYYFQEDNYCSTGMTQRASGYNTYLEIQTLVQNGIQEGINVNVNNFFMSHYNNLVKTIEHKVDSSIRYSMTYKDGEINKKLSNTKETKSLAKELLSKKQEALSWGILYSKAGKNKNGILMDAFMNHYFGYHVDADNIIKDEDILLGVKNNYSSVLNEEGSNGFADLLINSLNHVSHNTGGDVILTSALYQEIKYDIQIKFITSSAKSIKLSKGGITNMIKKLNKIKSNGTPEKFADAVYSCFRTTAMYRQACDQGAKVCNNIMKEIEDKIDESISSKLK